VSNIVQVQVLSWAPFGESSRIASGVRLPLIIELSPNTGEITKSGICYKMHSRTFFVFTVAEKSVLDAKFSNKFAKVGGQRNGGSGR
jgi:hypothetical protein